ncbi:MAG TPA: anti-sigma factor [Candidatus Dormibacteraeota bacterium]|nr:anti-sigma factor [Candidatus Dormibacteraeota bacterium]
MADADPDLPHLDLAGYVLGTLDARERESFERHLAGCARCRRELAELRGVPALMDEAADPVDVPPGMEARVLGRIARERRPARQRRTRPLWALAAAAAVAIAFLAGLGLGRGLPAGGGAQPAAPAARTMRLVAADGGAASAVATIQPSNAGVVIQLSVRDLPPPPAGHFYTCWLVADDDTLQHQDRVSVGSFATSDRGTATVRWETAADLARYPNLGVTLEPDNGNPLHQGPKVLTASA